VFGLGDLNYINFNQMGKRTELNMDRLGAKKIYSRGIGDASQDIEADLRRWIDEGLIEAVRENVPNFSRTGSKPVVVLTCGIPDLLDMVTIGPESLDQPLSQGKGMNTLSKVFWTLSSGEIFSKKELRQESSSSSSTCEVVVRLPTETRYSACDTVEILPHNSEQLVSEICEILKIKKTSLDEKIDFASKQPGIRILPFPTPCTLRTALTQFLDLSCPPSKTFISNLAVLNRHNSELEEALCALANNTVAMKELSTDYCITISEFLKLFSYFFNIEVKLSVSEFLQIGPKQRVRAYTGASCLGAKNNSVKLVVSLTAGCKPSLEPLISHLISCGVFPDRPSPHWAKERGDFRGLCSYFLCNISESVTVQFRVRESILRPPSSPTTVLAIATGAGLAPVMAYIDECERRNFFHNFYLVFGCRNSNQDFIYRERILKLQEEGKLRCWFAFSREGIRKAYVQDLIKETKEIHKIISDINNKAGRIMICGNTGMGRSVCEAIGAQVGGQAQLETMERSGKLVVEYFG